MRKRQYISSKDDEKVSENRINIPVFIYNIYTGS